MAFSEKLANVVADQLSRFVTLNRHQLAGQVANLDFWITQARHALGVIDGYEERFRRLNDAQSAYVAEHDVQVLFPTDPGISGAPGPPQRGPYSSLREARRSVTEATRRFLVRCCNDGLIAESGLREMCTDLDIGVESTDIQRRQV